MNTSSHNGSDPVFLIPRGLETLPERVRQRILETPALTRFLMHAPREFVVDSLDDSQERPHKVIKGVVLTLKSTEHKDRYLIAILPEGKTQTVTAYTNHVPDHAVRELLHQAKQYLDIATLLQETRHYHDMHFSSRASQAESLLNESLHFDIQDGHLPSRIEERRIALHKAWDTLNLQIMGEIFSNATATMMRWENRGGGRST